MKPPDYEKLPFFTSEQDSNLTKEIQTKMREQLSFFPLRFPFFTYSTFKLKIESGLVYVKIWENGMLHQGDESPTRTVWAEYLADGHV